MQKKKEYDIEQSVIAGEHNDVYPTLIQIKCRFSLVLHWIFFILYSTFLRHDIWKNKTFSYCKRILLISFLFLLNFSGTPPAPTLQIALLKYSGGGDWYANPTSLSNLVKFCNKNLNTNISEDIATAEVGSDNIYNYPFIHMTGHGNVVFSAQESLNLRNYLIGGGFLHVSDNYGIDKFLRREMKKVFPEIDFVELPFNHAIYHQKYQFSNGLAKIHEHDNKAAQGFGLIWEGRLVCFYDYECDLGDGWEDYDVHKDSEATRLKALQMGANIIKFAFNQ